MFQEFLRNEKMAQVLVQALVISSLYYCNLFACMCHLTPAVQAGWLPVAARSQVKTELEMAQAHPTSRTQSSQAEHPVHPTSTWFGALRADFDFVFKLVM